jgi:choline transport protein
MVFPPYRPVSAENMNYASLVLGLVLMICAASWGLYGRKVYGGPVREVIENLNVRNVAR